ncbi:hypothetical protein AA313_de0204958 [Arthrobotrys entomopaga]|nr:hypothetical protein AA313_de0204958 [Arthrobotrys entomopaga]
MLSGYMNEYMPEIQAIGTILQRVMDAQSGSYRVGYSPAVEGGFIETLRDYDEIDAEEQGRDIFETVPELTYIQQSDLLSDILKRIQAGIRDGAFALAIPMPTGLPGNVTVKHHVLRDIENLLRVNEEARTEKWDVEINEDFASDDFYERDLDAFEVRNFLQAIETFGEAIANGWVFPDDPTSIFAYILNINGGEPGNSAPLRVNVDGPREYIEGLEILRHTINKYKSTFQRALQGALRHLPPDNQLVVEATDQANSILDFFTFYSDSMGILSTELQKIAEGVSNFDVSGMSSQDSEYDEDRLDYKEDDFDSEDEGSVIGINPSIHGSSAS